MSVDIVNLIESNPITKLNGNYQSKLIEKVKNSFSEYEQQVFVASFYCYLNYSKTDFVIDLDDVWKWLGFSQKDAAKRLLEKIFTLDIDYKCLLHLQVEQKKGRGGHNKEILMLSVKTFKLFCIKAGTKKADEIHDYYVKLEEVLQDVIEEESNELKLQLEQQKTEMQQIEDKTKQEYETKLGKQKILEREKILLNEYGTSGSILYIVKVKTFENGQYIIKVGESRRGIKGRYLEHRGKYEECVLLDCFPVQNSKDFESFVHNHENVRPNKVTNLQGHETELELFLIGKNLSYQSLLNIINNNIKYFNNNDTNKLDLEIEKLKIMLEMKNTNNDNLIVQELQKTINNLSCKIDNLEKTNKEMLNKFNSLQTKTTTKFNEPLPTLGPRLQQIHPETMQLVKVYECVTELMKENQNIKRPSINKAIVENTIYCDFRWLLVDRQLDPNIIHTISPTKHIHAQNIGYIAQINSDQTEIINVYLDRKTAAHYNGYLSPSSLDNPVKNFTITNGHYYTLFNKCSPELQKKFIEIHGEPLLYKDGVGLYNNENQLQQEFSCKYEVIRQLKISDKTLAKALDKNILYNNQYFKRIGSKLKCIT